MRRLIGIAVIVLSAPAVLTAQSWTTPWTATTGVLVTAAQLNQTRDNLSVLRAGGITVTSQVTGDFLCASSATQFARLAAVGSGSILASNGTSTCPTYSSSPTIGGSPTLSAASSVLTFSGATTPEILFSAANANINSNASVIFEIDKDNNGSESFIIRDGASTPMLTLTEGGLLFVSDTANTNMTIGVTINQGSADNEFLTGKSSDVAHGITDLAETDSFSTYSKQNGDIGGLLIRGIKETGGSANAFVLQGITADAADTTKSTAGGSLVVANASIKSGTSVTSVGANGGLFSVGNNGSTQAIIDAEGDLWLNGNLMLETSTNTNNAGPNSPDTNRWGNVNSNWLSTPNVWFVILNEAGTSYRVPGYTP